MKTESHGHLTRAFGLPQATALNVANMVGVGPFITIPLLMASMGGPQSMLGWFSGALIAVSDGLIWSELGAALPGSGGSYHFLREAYGHQTWGRFMAFLFIWQFVLSGPLEVASGMIGIGNYSSYLWPGLTVLGQHYVAAARGPYRAIPLMPPDDVFEQNNGYAFHRDIAHDGRGRRLLGFPISTLTEPSIFLPEHFLLAVVSCSASAAAR